jgi:hypothetical protein
MYPNLLFFCSRSEYFPHCPFLPLQWMHPYKTRGRTKIVYMLTDKFIVMRWEDNSEPKNHKHSTNSYEYYHSSKRLELNHKIYILQYNSGLLVYKSANGDQLSAGT